VHRKGDRGLSRGGVGRTREPLKGGGGEGGEREGDKKFLEGGAGTLKLGTETMVIPTYPS
jgi:hypothetical protein